MYRMYKLLYFAYCLTSLNGALTQVNIEKHSIEMVSVEKWTAKGPKIMKPGVTFALCSVMCTQLQGCRYFQYDSVSKECKLTSIFIGSKMLLQFMSPSDDAEEYMPIYVGNDARSLCKY